MIHLYNIASRIALIVIKGLFALYIVSKFSLEFVGQYAIFTALVLITASLSSHDNHTYFFRKFKFTKHLPNHIIQIHQSLLIVLAIVYSTIGTIIIYLFIMPGLSFMPLICLLLYLITEIILLDHARQLFAEEESTKANIVHFFKGGFGIVIFVTIIEFGIELSENEIWPKFIICIAIVNLAIVIKQWTYLRFKLRDIIISRRRSQYLGSIISRNRYNYFILLFAQVNAYSDRFIIASLAGPKTLGAYYFFVNFVNIISSLNQVSFQANIIPKLIKSINNQDTISYRIQRSALFANSFFLASILSLFIYLTVVLYVRYEEHSELKMYIQHFPLILIGGILQVCANNISQIFYAQRLESQSFKITITTSLTAVLIFWVFVGQFGSEMVFFSFLLVSSMNYGVREYARRLFKI